ncbi:MULTISPECIES: ABC transporter permease [Paenibacillus]|uniref:ABC transporter permease n=1 Tax=Paenibacillus TaxID=44249 RepID=UPI0003E26C32|nr:MULTISPECIES: ABC transporter permease [Paenibacillus]ETT38930.1 Wzm [Paenibacillus sp. FSL R5-808]
MNLFSKLYNNRRLIFKLAINDFKSKYVGSYLGIIWAFVQPIATTFVFWFVFQVGLRVGAVSNDVPFALWLILGLVPWFFFSDAVNSATSCFYEYNYLVKKIQFNIGILPIVKIFSAFFVHVAFIILFILIYYSYGGSLDIIKILGFLYYTFCNILLIIGIVFITSSISVFVKDINQVVAIVLQFGMWLTPIMWSTELIPNNLKFLFEINPLFYVTEGYRTLLFDGEFLPSYNSFLFWFITLGLLIVGWTVFKRSKPHFADVI